MKSLTKEQIIRICFFLMGGIFVLFLIRFTPIGNNTITKENTKIIEKNSLSSSIEKVIDSVVYITNQDNGIGTGFIYKKDYKYGYILTNEHVIKDKNNIEVTTSKDERVKGELLSKDEYLDLAVLRIPKKYVHQIAKIGDSNKVKVGDTIFTIGSPVGYEYRGSVTSGILSGKDRMVPLSITENTDNDWVMKVLQVDASINPGNSGGPLCNINGEVIGIVALKLTDEKIEGMGFAIPIEDVEKEIEFLESGKEKKYPTLGIEMVNINDETALLREEFKTDETEGVLITKIKKDSSAEKSGLQEKDIIKMINDKNIKDIANLKYQLYEYQPNDQIEITIIRNNKIRKIKVTLG